MALYVLSDTHLSLSCDKPMDIFGYRWKDYQNRIAENWQNTVSDGDTVIVAGDVSWGMSLDDALSDFKFLDSLPGTKLLGKGNHDYWWDTVKKMTAFLEKNGIKTLKFLYNNAYSVEGITVCGSRGWWSDKKSASNNTDYDKMVAREAMRTEHSILDGLNRFGGEPTVFLHFPPVHRELVCREIMDVLHKYNVKRCYYGHIHNVYNLEPRFEFEGIEFIITSADYLSFKPLKVDLEAEIEPLHI